MSHIVEALLDAAKLVERLEPIHRRLGPLRCESGGFRVASRNSDGKRVRVGFAEATATRAFARALGCRLLEDPAAV